MRILNALILSFIFCAPAWGHDCEPQLTGLLTRGPFQLDLDTSEIRWPGEGETFHSKHLAPRELEAMRSVFWAGLNLPESQPIGRKDILAAHAKLYPTSTLKSVNLFSMVAYINREISDEDSEMTYRIVAGFYDDVITFSWDDFSIPISEDEYTLLSLLQSRPNQKVSYPEMLAALKHSLPHWEYRSNPHARIQLLLLRLREKNLTLPVERLRSAYRWQVREATAKIEFRGFTLDIELCRLIWQVKDKLIDMRLSPIECAVVKERFERGEGSLSWQEVFKAPNEERLKTASLVALRVHFSNVRSRVLAISPNAANRFTTSR